MTTLLLMLPLLGLCAGQFSPNVACGRTSIVHLFEWRWEDIAEECERYLGPNGFGGVQISPPNENVIITNPNRPWWERYQPISYKICTRSGDEQQFRDMVTRCNSVGVHIYVDAVINHMCGSGVGKGTSSTCGSYYDSDNRNFSAVPYSFHDFNDKKCKTGSGNIEDYRDADQVRDCRLVSLLDLALEKDYIREKIADYMNKLIDIGVAGFRLDAAKHMWPGDIQAIVAKLHNLNTKWFPEGSRPFIFQEDIYNWIGPPMNPDGSIKHVPINADSTCGDDWVCEHRWRQIKNMVIFRNTVNFQPLTNWWDNGGNQIAFGREDKGFIVFNNEEAGMDVTLNTGLPAGTYCDVISGQKEETRCTGIEINVSDNGSASFRISNLAEDPFVAIHVGAKL